MIKFFLATVILASVFATAHAKWPEMGAVVFVGEIINKPIVLQNGYQVFRLRNYADCRLIDAGSDTKYSLKEGDSVVIYGLSGGPAVEILSLSVVNRAIKLGGERMNNNRNRFFGYREFRPGVCGNRVPSLSP